MAVIKYEFSHRTHRSLALEYGVSTTTIGQIDRGQAWNPVAPKSLTSLDDAPNEADQAGE